MIAKAVKIKIVDVKFYSQTDSVVSGRIVRRLLLKLIVISTPIIHNVTLAGAAALETQKEV